MLFPPIAVGSADASTQTAQQAAQKIIRGKCEVTSTQIGRISKIYKVVNGVEKFRMGVKKRPGWRVHGLIKDGKKTYYVSIKRATRKI